MNASSLLPAFLVAATTAMAGPLPSQHVPADAKWVVHLDVDALLSSQFGEFIAREMLDPKLTKASAGLRKEFDLEFDWRKIHSLTAYGSDFPQSPEKLNGVLIVRSDLDIADAMDRVLEKFEASGQAPFRKLQQEPFPVYGNKDVVGTPIGKDLFVLSRSRERLDQARRTIESGTGRAAAPAAEARAASPAGFLTVAISDTSSIGAALPPQARALKDMHDVRFVAGEKADQVFVSASLEARDSTVAQQLQQMLQGVIAFGQMSQADNQELQRLAQSAKVGGADKRVTLELQLPVQDVIAKVGKNHKKRRG